MPNALTRNINSGNETPQNEVIPGREADMAENNAGGFTFKLDKWEQLRRFLILGTEGGTYYVSERKLTAENTIVVDACIAEDGIRTVNEIISISTNGLAPKNTQAIYALAVAASADDPAVRTMATGAIDEVCRTGTHLYQFTDFVQSLGRRGWGRGFRTGIAHNLTNKSVERLALQAVKYRQREGWTYRDLLRKSHAFPTSEAQDILFAYMVGNTEKANLDAVAEHEELNVLQGFIRMQDARSAKQAAGLIEKFNLPWEAVPDKFRKEEKVWNALLPHMGVTALTRNIAQLARLKFLTPMSETEKFIVSRLTDPKAIKGSREHPIRFLDASLVHASGGKAGLSRGDTYTTNQNIVSALEKAFILAFKNVVPTGKNHYLALDVSGSMDWQTCAGSAVITPREGAAAMALITASVEDNTYSAAFTGEMQKLHIDGKDTLRSTLKKTNSLSFGSTNCSLPMQDALKKKIEVDMFVVYTDNETWAGRSGHPSQALESYRQKMGRPARLAVVGMTSTGFSIADPADSGMMDFVGFNAATPRAIAIFGSDES